MSSKLIDRRDLQFCLYEMLDVEALTRHPWYADHSRETFDLALDSAYAMAREQMWPVYQDFDREGVAFDGKRAKAPSGMKPIWKSFGEGGWFAASAACEHGGQQFPHTIFAAVALMMSAANTTAAMYLGQATGAAHLLESFGSDFLRDRFMYKLFTGEWAGTMALTEPQAGTSLGDIATSARKALDGDYYFIKGTKRFISSGDHDLTPNIVHPTLAKIDGAPPGVKGISLFIVPTRRVNDDGSLGDWNDVNTGGVEHKLGLRGQATATLNFGENDRCIGYLLGDPNKGLQYMFQLMNMARIHTGIQAIAQASTAYHHAVEYAKERVQGRAVTNRDAASRQVPIIEHADVRRMLLTQKAYVEGVIGLLLYCARLGDELRVADSEARRKELNGLLELLTPVCKAYASDVAFESINLAMQVYGGNGYMEEYPIAQLMRDNRVFSIYEGTNTVQAMDLLGRKVPAESGAYFRSMMEEIGRTLAEIEGDDSLRDLHAAVKAAMEECIALTMHLGQLGLSGNVELYMSHATPYLRVFSQLVVAWILLRQAKIAADALGKIGADALGKIGADALAGDAADRSFYESKIATARYYIANILPMSTPIARIIMHDDRSALDFRPDWF